MIPLKTKPLRKVILPVLSRIPFLISGVTCGLYKRNWVQLKSSIISSLVEHDSRGNIHGEVFIEITKTFTNDAAFKINSTHLAVTKTPKRTSCRSPHKLMVCI